MKYRVGEKPVYEARRNKRHVKIISLVKQFYTWSSFENKTWAELENKTWEEMEYEKI